MTILIDILSLVSLLRISGLVQTIIIWYYKTQRVSPSSCQYLWVEYYRSLGLIIINRTSTDDSVNRFHLRIMDSGVPSLTEGRTRIDIAISELFSSDINGRICAENSRFTYNIFWKVNGIRKKFWTKNWSLYLNCFFQLK